MHAVIVRQSLVGAGLLLCSVAGYSMPWTGATSPPLPQQQCNTDSAVFTGFSDCDESCPTQQELTPVAPRSKRLWRHRLPSKASRATILDAIQAHVLKRSAARHRTVLRRPSRVHTRVQRGRNCGGARFVTMVTTRSIAQHARLSQSNMNTCPCGPFEQRRPRWRPFRC